MAELCISGAGDRPGGGGESAVISTHTISLQEQLMEKDIPVLAGGERAGIFGGAVQGGEQLLGYAAAGAGELEELGRFFLLRAAPMTCT